MKRSVKGFAFLLLTLVIFSFISISFVAAVGGVAGTADDDGTLRDSALNAVATGAKKTTTVAERMFGPLGALFKGGAMSESTQLFITKLLLIFLVVIVVYAVSSFLPFFPEKQSGLRWAFSIVIGLLAFIFVKSEEIKMLLINYQALGIAVTTIIPLIVIIAITYKLRDDERSKAYAGIINKIIISVFFLYLLFQWYTMTLKPIEDDTSIPPLYWLYPATALITLLWFFVESYTSKKIKKAQSEAEQEAAEDAVNDFVGGVKAGRKAKRSLAMIGKDDDE